MPNQQFTLIVEGADLRSARVFDAIFEAGCDDATVGSIDDTHHIDFDREAASLCEAILSAVRDVEKVKGLRVTRVADVDLVSVADIAKRTGRTRESVRSLVARERGPVRVPRSRSRTWKPLPVLALDRRQRVVRRELRRKRRGGRPHADRHQREFGTPAVPSRADAVGQGEPSGSGATRVSGGPGRQQSPEGAGRGHRQAGRMHPRERAPAHRRHAWQRWIPPRLSG